MELHIYGEITQSPMSISGKNCSILAAQDLHETCKAEPGNFRLSPPLRNTTFRQSFTTA